MKYSKEYLLKKGYKLSNNESYIKKVKSFNILVKLDGTVITQKLDKITNLVHCSYAPAMMVYSKGMIGEYWFINGKISTNEIELWLQENNIRRPMNKAARVLFILTFL